jgi:hypothetical protein
MDINNSTSLNKFLHCKGNDRRVAVVLLNSVDGNTSELCDVGLGSGHIERITEPVS